MATSDPLTGEFHQAARAPEVLSNLQEMLAKWQAKYPEGKPFQVRVYTRDVLRVRLELIPIEEPN
jgi:hypothetical protein